MLLYMEHANVTVSSIDKAMSFLQTVFPEFEVRGERQSESKRWIRFGTADSYIALEEMVETHDSGRRRGRDIGINHIGWVVDDLDALVRRASDGGYDPGEVFIEGGGPARKRVYIMDGIGNEWEFVQYLTVDDQKRNVYE